MNHVPAPNERLFDLLADRSVSLLDDNAQAELDALLAAHPNAEDGSFEHAATALMLALAGPIEPMPAELQSRIVNSLQSSAPATSLRLTQPIADPKRSRLVMWGWSGWLAAAACLVIAVSLVMNRPTQSRSPSLAEARGQFLQLAADAQRTNWADWDNPEQPGVTGEVAWSEAEQRGYMTFSGLAVNDPTVEQYQLWIIDERGMEQRISGAIFNCDTQTGECVVEISPGIEVHNAAAFAVTIEKPEGVWVSDMSRRVVIATLSG